MSGRPRRRGDRLYGERHADVGRLEACQAALVGAGFEVVVRVDDIMPGTAELGQGKIERQRHRVDALAARSATVSVPRRPPTPWHGLRLIVFLRERSRSTLRAFVICDDAVPSGHIDELHMLAQLRVITAILSPESARTCMQADYDMDRSFLRRFRYSAMPSDNLHAACE